MKLGTLHNMGKRRAATLYFVSQLRDEGYTACPPPLVLLILSEAQLGGGRPGARPPLAPAE